MSVVMPVYNAEKFLKESIDSILRQTFDDFEFIIINDGSTDNSQDIIDYYSSIDSRVVAVKQSNHGVVYTANKAIDLSKGEYVARIDADDIALPQRLEQEVAILNKHKNTVLVCSSFEVIDEDGEFLYKNITTPDNTSIKRALYLRNPIANGSTMIRKEALLKVGKFDDIFAEDFHLWMKLEKLGDFEATGTVLYRWRMNTNGLTLSNNDLSMSQAKLYIDSLWEEKTPENVTLKDIKMINNFYSKDHTKDSGLFESVALSDISQLAAKLFISGHYTRGLRQLFVLAFSSKKGFKASINRVYFVIRGKIPNLRKYKDEQIVSDI